MNNRLKLENVKSIILNNSYQKNKIFKKIDEEKKKIDILDERLEDNIKKFINKSNNYEEKIKIRDMLNNINMNMNDHQKLYFKKILLQKITNYKIHFSNYDKELIKFYKDIILKKKFFYRNSLKLTYFNINDKIYFPELESYDKNELFIAFGLNKLTSNYPFYIKQIFNYLCEYLLSLDKKFVDIDYIKNDIYLLQISRMLLTNKLKLIFINK